MKTLSSFTHPYVVPSLCDLLPSLEHKIRFWRMLVNNFFFYISGYQ